MLTLKRLIPVAALAAILASAMPLWAAPGEKYPQTKTRLLKGSEINKMSLQQSQYAINEIFARHGLLFGDMKLRKQFLPFDWYKPEPGLSAADARKRFNSYERRNVERLVRVREREAPPQPYASPYKTGSQGLAGERFPETRLDEMEAEIEDMSDAQIDFAINEIYARHGLVFGDMKLRKHFLSLSWYKPKPKLSANQVAKTFSKLETKNADALAYERAMRQDDDRGAQ